MFPTASALNNRKIRMCSKIAAVYEISGSLTPECYSILTKKNAHRLFLAHRTISSPALNDTLTSDFHSPKRGPP